MPSNPKPAPENMPDYIRRVESGWHILLRVQPGAKKTEICGELDGALRIRLAAPAVDNKANAALLEFIAAALKIKKNKPVLSSGDKSRQKKVFIPAEADPDFTALLPVARTPV